MGELFRIQDHIRDRQEASRESSETTEPVVPLTVGNRDLSKPESPPIGIRFQFIGQPFETVLLQSNTGVQHKRDSSSDDLDTI